MKTCVTGSCGFQATHLVEALLEQGHEVWGIAIPSVTSTKNYHKYLADLKGYHQVWGSVNDADLVHRTVGLVDEVFHLAAKINVDESIYDFKNFYKTNILGTSNVLEACRKHNAALVHVSTCEVMGENDSELPMAEDRILRPHSPYAASKCGGERMCYAYAKTHDMDIKMVRPFNLYGPRQKRGGAGALIPILFEQAIKDGDLTVFGSGSQDRDYIYVDDIIRAYMLIRDTPELKGKVVHVGSGKPQKVIGIAQKIIDIVGKGRIVHKPERPGEVRTFTADNTLIESFGYKTEVEFDDGLKRYYDWRTKLD